MLRIVLLANDNELKDKFIIFHKYSWGPICSEKLFTEGHDVANGKSTATDPLIHC